MIMAVAVGVRRNHGKMLYYNITDVYEPNGPNDLERTTGSVANAVNDDPGRVRSVEYHIRIGTCDDAAEIIPVGDASGVGMIGEQTNDGRSRLLTVSAPCGDRASM
jgi:hypothetical protein